MEISLLVTSTIKVIYYMNKIMQTKSGVIPDPILLHDLKEAVSQAVHQCNNHLAIILTNCELIQISNDPVVIEKKTNSILSRVEILGEVLTALNNFSHFEYDATIVQSDLKDELNKAINNSQELFLNSSSQVKVTGLSIAPIVTQVDILSQAIQLLFKSCLFFSEKLSERYLKISIEDAGSHYLISFATPSGSNPEDDFSDQEKMFKTYFPSKKNIFCEGLALASTYIKLLAGTISLSKNSTEAIINIKILKNLGPAND